MIDNFKTPEMDMTGIQAAFYDLQKANQDLIKARKLRDRGIAMFVVGVSVMGVGIYKLIKN